MCRVVSSWRFTMMAVAWKNECGGGVKKWVVGWKWTMSLYVRLLTRRILMEGVCALCFLTSKLWGSISFFRVCVCVSCFFCFYYFPPFSFFVWYFFFSLRVCVCVVRT
jgi:hypothetical protein